MKFDVITIFPHIFDSYLKESILARAQKQGLIEIAAHDLRDYTADKHRTVDDSPYGGGVGMVMLVEPIYKALLSLRGKSPQATDRSNPKNAPRGDDKIAALRPTGGVYPNLALDAGVGARNDNLTTPNPSSERRGCRTILLSPRGQRLTQAKVKQLATYDRLILIAGRYEGVDERVTEFVDETISIGDFVLAGGETAAMVIIEAVSRLIPGVLGKDESSKEESFSDDDSAEYPQYTRPEVFTTDDGKELKVPEVLLSGHHAEIAKWRKKQRK